MKRKVDPQEFARLKRELAIKQLELDALEQALRARPPVRPPLGPLARRIRAIADGIEAGTYQVSPTAKAWADRICAIADRRERELRSQNRNR
jgi:hypothetical protein